MDFRVKYRRHRPDKHEAQRQQEREKDALSRMRGLAIGMSIPAALLAGPLAGWLAGAALDRALGTAYWTLILIILGTAAALKLVIDMLAKLSKGS